MDYVNRMYNIYSLDDFTVESMIKEVNRIALKNKKQVKVYKICEWTNIARVYFQVFDKKITEQWTKNQSNHLMVDVDFDNMDELEEIAHDNDTNVSQLVCDVLDDFILNSPK